MDGRALKSITTRLLTLVTYLTLSIGHCVILGLLVFDATAC
jgi:hypothetical protein